MSKLLPFKIGLRYTRAKRSNTFISFVSIFAFLGMALGVFALILVLSVMNGFDNELKQRTLKAVPHGYLTQNSPLVDWPALVDRVVAEEVVIAAAPFVKGTGLLSMGAETRAVEIHGIDPVSETQVSVIHENMLAGNLDVLESGRYRIVIGVLLARTLGVTLGDRVVLTLPKVSVTPAGVFPRSRAFTVEGVFEVGAQLDQTLVLVNLRDARKLFLRGDSVDGLRLRFDNIYKAGENVKDLEAALGSQFDAKDWSETQSNLFGAIKMEKTVIGLLLSIIVVVAAFNIVTSLIMMVEEKRSDIAVLRTMGLSKAGIVVIFIVQGMTIGVVGIFIGVVLGLFAALNISAIVAWFEGVLGVQLFDASVYFVSYLPSDWRLEDTVVVTIAALVMSFLATCYPAYRASKIPPAEALRYDI